MIVKVVVPDSIYAQVYFARGEQGAQGPTGNTGPQGPSGIVNVDSPITNSGTSTAANIGLNQALLQITPAQVTGTAVITTDSRLSDQRVPTDGSVTDTKIVAGGLSPNRISGTAVITTDSRLSDARTPLAHAASHGSAGSDAITIAQSQVTGLTSTISGLQTGINAKANSASPTFTGTITTPITSGSLLWTNSSGVLDKVGDAPGLGYVPYTGAVSGGIAWQALSDLAKISGGNAFTGAQTITGTVAGSQVLTLTGASGQTADLLRAPGGARIPAAGNYFIAPGITSTYVMDATAGAATVVPLTVKGAASQSANLMEFRNSSNTLLSRIDQNGSISVPFLGSTVAGSSYLQTNADTQSITFFAGAAASKGIVVRGFASQSANLQEWQNSAGTIQAQMEPAGTLRANFLALFSNLGTLSTQNSGGLLSLARSTAAASNPGNNFARIYFRDGTNAGTLKLVVRAGAAGAETTILDNIPQ